MSPIVIQRKNPKRFIWAVVILLVVGVIFAWVYYRYDLAARGAANYANPVLDQQKQNAQKELQDTIAKVGKHIVLPTGETPALAIVNDAAKLAQTQPFYKDAQNGDKVLVYFQAKKAFIYDPNRDIVVNVGPVITQKDNKTEVKTGTSTPL
ncbi:MAG: hypothetical protein WC526_02120 [Patescibacteria group bacterium]